MQAHQAASRSEEIRLSEQPDFPEPEGAEPTHRPEPQGVPAAVPPAAIEMIADDIERRLDPRFVILQRMAGWIVTGAISFGLIVAIPIVGFSMRLQLRWLGLMMIGWLAVTCAVGWMGQYWPGVEHRHRAYRVNDRGIEIRSGVFWRRVVTVPRSRVQHTDVSQGPLERRYGLGTLVIHTAGTEHSMVQLPGLEHGIAARIRDHLVAGGEDDAV